LRIQAYAAPGIELEPVLAGDMVKVAFGELERVGTRAQSGNHGTDVQICHKEPPPKSAIRLNRASIQAQDAQRRPIPSSEQRSLWSIWLECLLGHEVPDHGQILMARGLRACQPRQNVSAAIRIARLRLSLGTIHPTWIGSEDFDLSRFLRRTGGQFGGKRWEQD
jgi:hypothetical protein